MVDKNENGGFNFEIDGLNLSGDIFWSKVNVDSQSSTIYECAFCSAEYEDGIHLSISVKGFIIEKIFLCQDCFETFAEENNEKE